MTTELPLVKMAMLHLPLVKMVMTMLVLILLLAGIRRIIK